MRGQKWQSDRHPINKTVQYNKTLNKNKLKHRHEIYVKHMKYSKALNTMQLELSLTIPITGLAILKYHNFYHRNYFT